MSLTEDPIINNIARIRITKIDVMLTTHKVVPLWEIVDKSRVRSCLWPRVTIELDGKQVKIPLVEFDKNNVSISSKSLTKIGRAIFKLACGKLNKYAITKNQIYAAYKLELKIKQKISIKLNAAANKNSFTKTIKATWRKGRRGIMEKKVIDIFREAVLIFRKQDIVALWEEQRKLLICSTVINS